MTERVRIETKFDFFFHFISDEKYETGERRDEENAEKNIPSSSSSSSKSEKLAKRAVLTSSSSSSSDTEAESGPLKKRLLKRILPASSSDEDSDVEVIRVINPYGVVVKEKLETCKHCNFKWDGHSQHVCVMENSEKSKSRSRSSSP